MIASSWTVFRKPLLGLAAIFLLQAHQAHAEEIYVGAAVNGVNTPFSLDIDEEGTNFILGVRGNPEKGLKKIGSPSLYIFAAVNDGGGTSFVAGGLSWHIDLAQKIYFRPGIGIALQGRTAQRFRLSDNRRTDLGSAILFEPELILGYELSDKISAELTWQHISHATLFSGQNPGVDMMGARIAFKL